MNVNVWWFRTDRTVAPRSPGAGARRSAPKSWRLHFRGSGAAPSNEPTPPLGSKPRPTGGPSATVPLMRSSPIGHSNRPSVRPSGHVATCLSIRTDTLLSAKRVLSTFPLFAYFIIYSHTRKNSRANNLVTTDDVYFITYAKKKPILTPTFRIPVHISMIRT